MNEAQMMQLYATARHEPTFESFVAKIQWEKIANDAALVKELREHVHFWKDEVTRLNNYDSGQTVGVVIYSVELGYHFAPSVNWESILGQSLYLAAPQASEAVAEPKATLKDHARRFLSDFRCETGFTMSDAQDEIMLNLFLKHASLSAENRGEQAECAPRADTALDAKPIYQVRGKLNPDCGWDDIRKKDFDVLRGDLFDKRVVYDAPRTDVEKDAALTQCAECAKWKGRYEHVRDMDDGDFGILAWSGLTTEQKDAHIDEEIAANKEGS